MEMRDKNDPIGEHNPFLDMEFSPACNHVFVHLETKKIRGERPSIGISSAVDWERIDIFFCQKCLEYEAVTRRACWIEFQDRAPEWW